ncbi:MAG: hypothetical protein DMF75_21915 [Acidobacteria bacterium]|nr:MAG: hypothetical protein DMF75_21915 [Acidobacteriota bacterium]
MRIIAGEFPRQDIATFQARELRINISRGQANRHATVAHGANRGAISAIKLLLVTTQAGIMIGVTEHPARFSSGSNLVWRCC